jgi:hypothetical protein
MPSLTPIELQEARRRSGRLGGRPKRPTVEEARRAALEELVPAAIKSLRAHLGDGDPAAWRAALRVFEHAFGRAPEVVEDDVSLPSSEAEVGRLSWAQMQLLAARIVAEPTTANDEAVGATGLPL